jgi:hypothetical protein
METLNTDVSAGQTEDPWDHPDIIASIDEMINNHHRTQISRPLAPGSTLHTSDTGKSPLKPLPELNPQKPRAYNRNCGNHQRTNTPTCRPSSIKKKPQRVWKPKATHPKLVLGMDVGLTEACNLALCALVGRLAYKEKCNLSLEDWIAGSWEPFLGYLPRILFLQNGWLGFIFKTPEDTVRVLDKFWAVGGGSLMLKRWRLSFNPSTEYFSYRHLWVLLPGLPLQLWNQQALELIGSSLGRFLTVDTASMESNERKMAKIMVELDIHAGLPEVLNIDWRGHLFAQRLDYLGIPFRCSFCRRTGHLRRECFKYPPTEPEAELSEEVGFNGYDTQSDVSAGESPQQRALDTDSQDNTLVSKIKLLCPSLYRTLSAWERLSINTQTTNSLQPASSIDPTDIPLPPEISRPAAMAPQPESLETTTIHSSPPLHNPSPLIDPTFTQPLTDSEPPENEPTPPPGYTEQPHSARDLDQLIHTIIPASPLPFDSLPIPLYLGKLLTPPPTPIGNTPSTSGVKEHTATAPSWSRGLGSEISPLKTRSARKKESTEASSSASQPTEHTNRALRGVKAQARAKS